MFRIDSGAKFSRIFAQNKSIAAWPATIDVAKPANVSLVVTGTI